MHTVSKDDVPILYELLVYEEWLQDPETLKSSSGSISSLTSLYPHKIISYLRHPEWPSEELIKALSPLLPWHVALSPSGLMVAILQEGLLEVRTHEDDFTSTVGKAIIPKDAFPQLRVLKWHPENNKIAVSSSHGVVTIFDAFCNHLFTLPLPNRDKCKHSQKFYVTGIELIDSKNQKKNERVVVVYSNGLIRSFTLPERDLPQENHTFQLNVDQVSCALYNKHFNILLVSSQPQPTTKYFQDSCFSAGLSAWQMISEYPYYRILFPSEEESKMLCAGGKLWNIFNFSKLQGVAVKLSVSQNNQFLASLHSCHTIIIWLIPSLRMYRKWSMDYNSDGHPDAGIKLYSAPVDIGWRHDEKLIVSRRDGSISVHHIETFDVCYGSGSELLSGFPRISSTENFPGFITLECDTILLSPSTEDSLPDCEKSSILDASSEMIQNTIYYITDIETFQPKKKSMKVIQKMYRMIGVKSTTPEELFWRKLDSNEYAGALELADEFGLNSDEVYKKLWRTSAVSSLSISENLSKIKNQSWVLNECVQRVPESISGAEDLLAFAFNITSMSSIFDDQTLSEDAFTEPSFSCDALDQLQKEKIVTRVILLNYADKLRAYKAILGGNPDADGSYDMVQYDRFRKLPIVVSAIYFARQCNIRAVEVVFKYYASGVMPYWFSILDNIPEIFPPSDYRNLLPGCDEEGIVVYWEDYHSPTEDWARNNVFRHLIPPLAQDVIVKELKPVLSISGSMLSDWYYKRALEIESRSKLIQFAQSLVRIGIEKNIKGLCDLNSNFTTLECMIYELELDIDTYTFLNMANLQKCIAMMEKTVPEDFTYKMLRYFVPFLNRHCKEHEKRYQLFFEFLSYTSQENLKSSLLFISYVLDENYDLIGGPTEITRLIVECIYSYKKFDLVHEIFEVIDSSISWIASQPKQTSELRNLLKKLNILREETFAAHVITGRGISTTVKAVHIIKLEEDEPKRILEQIISYVIKEYLKDKYISKVTDTLQDILSIQEMCFKKIHLNDCYKMYAFALLNSNCLPLIELSSSVLCSKKEVENDCFLSFDDSIKLVLHAAQKYFDCSESVEDEAMNLSKACLFLIKDDHNDINKEIDLIQALRYLKEIGVNLIPVQVRQSEDRMKLLHLCFEKNHELFRKSRFIYKLGAKLRVCGDNLLLRHNMITEKLAQVALAAGAVSFCTDFCVDLVVNNYDKGWEVVFKLLKRTTVGYQPIVKVFWSFCVIHAPSRYLNDLIDVRKSINMNTAISQYDGFGISEDALVSLVNTPDSENWDDYQLASSDSSHKLDEASDAEGIPGYCSPFFYSNGCESPEYEVAMPQHLKHAVFQVVHIHSEESLLAFVEAHNFSVDPWIVDSKLIELGARHLNKDTLTVLGFLLSANNPLSCEDFFDKLPQVTFVHEFAAYYYAICSLRGSSERILKPPFEAVSDAITLEHSEYRLSIAKYAKKCESLTQAKSLKEENCGVNYERFIEDESYKTDTIYGLAMSPDKLDIAFELAKKNNIPIIEIAMAHIEALFFEDKVDDIIRSFSENSELALVVKSSSAVVLDRLQYLFAIIDGAEHKKFINLFKIMQCMGGVECMINDLTAKEHVKLLKKIESTVPGLDYKDLVSQRKDLVSLLKPYLVNIETVGNCVKLAKSLPKSLKKNFATSLLYFEFSLHQFHTLCSGCKSLKQCASHFETIYPILAKLNQSELLEFIQRSLCDKEIVMKLDYVTRRQLLNSLLHWCYATNDGLRSNFDPVIQFIQEKLERLNIIWNDDDEDIFSNPSMKIYLCEVELYDPNDDLQNPKHLESLLERAMLDSSLLKSEQHLLMRVIKALEPQGSHFDTLSLESSVPEDTDDDVHQLPIPKPGNTPKKDEKLEAVKTFCEKIVANYSASRPTINFDNETWANSEITPAMLKYMFLPESPELDSVSEVSWSIDGMYYSKYDVAMTIIKASLPPVTFQKLAQVVKEAFNSNHTDKVFLVWLCLSCELLNLHDEGDSLLNSHIMADHLVHYVATHPECAERLVPRLILNNKFADVASTLVGEGDTMTVLCLIKALKTSRMSAEAGTLMMSFSRVPASLKTFDFSLWFEERSSE